MKTITLKVQVKIKDDGLDEDMLEEKLNDILYCIETPVEDDDGPLNHLEKYGHEIMIMDRSDKKVNNSKT